jgi:hypothetical protein
MPQLMSKLELYNGPLRLVQDEPVGGTKSITLDSKKIECIYPILFET